MLENIVSVGLESCTHNSQRFSVPALCRVFFAANDVVLSHNLPHKLWCLCRAVMSDVLCLYHL